MSDNYEFAKSLMPQGDSHETPYQDLQWNYIPDLNNGVYQSQGLSLVQFNLNNIFNNDFMTDCAKGFIAIPITTVSAYVSSVTAGTLVAPTTATSPWASTGLKSGYWQLVHQGDITNSGKQVEQIVPYLNGYVNFKMLSQMSQDDLNAYGQTLGMGDRLDNPQSVRFNGSGNQSVGTGTAGAFQTNTLQMLGTNGFLGGNGLVNNQPFPIANPQTTDGLTYSLVTALPVTTAQGGAGTGVTMTNTSGIAIGQLVTGTSVPQNTFVSAITANTSITLSNASTAAIALNAILSFYTLASNGNFGDQATQGQQFEGTYNNGYYSRLKRCQDTIYGTNTNLIGSTASVAISSPSQVATEFTSQFTILNTNYMVWYDVAIIRCADLWDSMKNMPLTKRFSGDIRLYLNTGAVASQISALGGQMVTSLSTNTFVATCPLIQSCLPTTPSGATGIVSGLFIQKAGATNLFGGVNLANSGASNPLTSCRFYFPQVVLHPEKLHRYLSENRTKKVCYTSCYYNTLTNLSSGASVSFPVQAGVKYIRGILIIPLISNTTYGSVNTGVVTSGVTTLAQFQSPFDTCPATTSPISLINVQATIGNVSVLKQSPLIFSFENFLEQVSMYEKLNSADLGLSCGLINEQWWRTNRYYYIDCSRGSIANRMTERNVNVSFTNNSLQTIDCIVYTEYFNELTIDVETGSIQKD